MVKGILGTAFLGRLILLLAVLLIWGMEAFFLFSKSSDPNSLRSQFQREPLCRYGGWFCFVFLGITILLMSISTYQAAYAWITYVPPWLA